MGKRTGRGKTAVTFKEIQETLAHKQKNGKGLSQPNSQQETPAWHFGIIDFDSPWGWRFDSAPFWEKIFGELRNFESMTWNEIYPGQSSGKTSHHPIKVEDFKKKNPEVLKRLKDINQNDIESLFSLRLSGTERIFGIRDGRVLKILWYDPTHQVYPVENK